MNYCGMYNWTNDVPEGHGNKQLFLDALELIRPVKNPTFLEIGTFAGTSIATISDLFPNGEFYAVDNWGLDSAELARCSTRGWPDLEISHAREAFFKNTKGHVTLIEKDSVKAMRDFIREGLMFDFIYVDGSHEAADALMDLTLAWVLLRDGGVLAIDDYLYEYPDNPSNRVKAAVDHFITKFTNEYTVISIGWRVFLQKLT